MISLGLVILACFALILLGVPVVFSFSAGVFSLILLFRMDFFIVVPVGFGLITSYGLLAVPLFMYAGALLGESGITDRIIALTNAIMGRQRGSLGAVAACTCAIFGAMSGSCTAACATIGTILYPQMTKQGYPKGYISGLVSTASLIAVLIPPSCIAIVYGVVARLPVTTLFLTTLIPGIMLTTLYIIINLFLCRKSRMPDLWVAPEKSFKTQIKEIGSATLHGFFALLGPFFVLGSIYGGLCTPTEAAGLLVVYSLVVGFFVYKGLTFKKLIRCTLNSASLIGAIMVVVFVIFTLSGIMIRQNVPQYLMAGIIAVSQNKYVILLLMNLLLLFQGMLMDDTSAAILAAVILAPVATGVGVNPYQFGAVVLINVTIGLVTPPVAHVLYLGARVCGNPRFDEYIKPTAWFLFLGHLPVLLLVTYVPPISLWLPRLMGFSVAG